MKSFLTMAFLERYWALPSDVRAQASRAYTLFQKDPHHPSLRFRQVHPTRPIFSARVGSSFRAVGIREGEEIFWYWIGSHSDYDQLLSQR